MMHHSMPLSKQNCTSIFYYIHTPNDDVLLLHNNKPSDLTSGKSSHVGLSFFYILNCGSQGFHFSTVYTIAIIYLCIASYMWCQQPFLQWHAHISILNINDIINV